MGKIPTPKPHSLNENYRLERVFRHFMIVYIRLLLKRPGVLVKEWPAMKQPSVLGHFVDRNRRYALPAEDPLYRQ